MQISQPDASPNSWNQLSVMDKPRSATEVEPPHSITRRLLNIHEVAQYTGLSIHTLYTMVSQRRIPYVKVGRLTKFDRYLLDQWIANQTVLPMPPK